MMHSTAAGRAGSSWASSDDMMIVSLIVIVLGVGVFGYLAWANFHGEISAAVIEWRRWEIGQLSRVTDAFAQADRQMAAANPYSVSFAALYRISHAIGVAWRLPGCALLILLAALCLWRNAPRRYRRKLNLIRLAVEMLPAFPATAAFLDQKLRLVRPSPSSLRPADYALTAEEWVAEFATDPKGALDESRANSALRIQLGQRWERPDALAPAALVLFVSFSYHLIGRRDEAARLLGEAGDTLTGLQAADDGRGPPSALSISGTVVSECHNALREHEAFTGATGIMQRHAWTATGLMSLLNVARTRAGVLAPAQFAWLKLVDRSLWYALQSLGFETEGVGRYLHPNPRVEAIGVRDHWATERACGVPLPKPTFDRALVILQTHARRLGSKPNPVRNRPVHSSAVSS